MRTGIILLTLLLVAMTASPVQASDPQSKPIKPAPESAPAKSDGHDAATPKEEIKPVKEPKSGRESKSSKEAKAAEAARLRDVQAQDDLATKIAERLAAIRKEKEVAVKPALRAHSHGLVVPIKHGVAQGTGDKTAKGTVAHHRHWSYEGETGPLSWGKLDPANAKCDLGERQSPIDIREGIRVDLDLIHFDYKLVPFAVVDNGHTIQVNLSSGNFINVSGKTFELIQFHFHRPSEERVNGRTSEMVAHLVHKDRDGKLAVIAVLLEIGKTNEIIQLVWNNLPLEQNEAVKAMKMLDVAQLIPAKREYYTYMGSLTTPPCSEGVLWIVMKETAELSSEQLGIFARLYPMNARPLQKTAGRLIKESK